MFLTFLLSVPVYQFSSVSLISVSVHICLSRISVSVCLTRSLYASLYVFLLLSVCPSILLALSVSPRLCCPSIRLEHRNEWICCWTLNPLQMASLVHTGSVTSPNPQPSLTNDDNPSSRCSQPIRIFQEYTTWSHSTRLHVSLPKVTVTLVNNFVNYSIRVIIIFLGLSYTFCGTISTSG